MQVRIQPQQRTNSYFDSCLHILPWSYFLEEVVSKSFFASQTTTSSITSSKLSSSQGLGACRFDQYHSTIHSKLLQQQSSHNNFFFLQYIYKKKSVINTTAPFLHDLLSFVRYLATSYFKHLVSCPTMSSMRYPMVVPSSAVVNFVFHTMSLNFIEKKY